MKSVRKFRSIPRSFDEFPIKRLDTLFNLGKAEGSIDGGQMIKPALARGLHLVGATTRMCLMYVTYQDTNFLFVPLPSQRMSTERRLVKMQLSSVVSNR